MIHRVYRLLFRRWRKKRFRKFYEIIQPRSGDTILDVGGTEEFWNEAEVRGVKIVCLNPRIPSIKKASGKKNLGIKHVAGDGCRLPYPSGSFSTGFSNSAIEHLGKWSLQVEFSRELLRVGEKIWVQTPAFECPIEPHFLAPFIHWLPKKWRKKLVRNFTLWGWLQRPDSNYCEMIVEEIRLLTKNEVKQLFPGCNILTERLFWIFPKSYIAWRAPGY